MKSVWMGLATLALSTKAFATPVFLGQTKLAEWKDRDVIKLPVCLPATANEPVRKLQLRVTRYAAEIDHVRVVFFNGDVQVLNLREFFPAGTGSRWIDLRGHRRCVKKIIIRGDAETPGWEPSHQSIVRFYGR